MAQFANRMMHIIVFQLVDVTLRSPKKVQKLIIRHGRIHKHHHGHCCHGDHEEDSDEECQVHSDGSDADSECDRWDFIGFLNLNFIIHVFDH